MWRKARAAFRGARPVPAEELARPGGAAPAGELRVLAPLLVPLPASALARAFNAALFRAVVRTWCRRLGFRDPALINYVPVLAGVMRGWRRGAPPGGPVVYHCVDRWDQFGAYDAALMSRLDRECRGHAELVVASSAELEAHCRRDHANVHVVSHGVDYAHFARALALRREPRPADCPDGPLAGFIGLLAEWVDQPLLVRVARAIRPASLVLIGQADVPVDALRAEPNVRVLGPRPFAALPRYVAHFEAGLIPFQVSELTRAVNPIKLREMLAAGCPVVSSALPEVARYAALAGVHVAAEADGFVAAVRECIERPLSEAGRRTLSEAMRGETWEAKTRQMVALIANRPERRERAARG
jgi:glycosyltransferase involved in cell wall biosynthesis